LMAIVADAPHRRDVNATTKRLVDRNLKAEWCTQLAAEDSEASSSVFTMSPISATDDAHQTFTLPHVHGASTASAVGLGQAYSGSPVKQNNGSAGNAAAMIDLVKDQNQDCRRGSTLSVNSVANSAPPGSGATPRQRHHRRISSESQLRLSPTTSIATSRSTSGEDHSDLAMTQPISSSLPLPTLTTRPATSVGRRPPPPTPKTKRKLPHALVMPSTVRRRSQSQSEVRRKPPLMDPIVSVGLPKSPMDPFVSPASPVDRLVGSMGNLKAR